MGSGTIKEGQDDCRIKDNFCSGPSHAEQVLQILNLYRQSGSFTDVVLQVEEKEFPCHRAVLSASSSYFRTMFSSQLQEQHQHLVQMNGISSTALEVVLNFMYEGLMNINEGNVAMVFQTADLLDVTVLRKVCIQFLEKQVDHSNCLGLMDFASFYTLTPLAEQCQKMLFQNFTQVYQHEEFTSLPKDRVKKLLSSEQMQVQSEEVLVKAVLKWVHHKPTSRKGELKELLELVHLPLLDPVFLLNSVESDSIVQDCPECRPLILEARRYHMFGREVHSHRTKPRRSSDRAEMIVVIGGCDRNGFSRLSFTEMFKPTSNEWMSGASIPGYSKSEFACCEFQNDVLVSGGALNSVDVWRYMSQLDQWVRVGSLNQGRWRHKMGALLGKLYVVGGYNGQERLSSVEAYSAYDNKWRKVAPLLLPVSSAALASCAGKLYVIGGAVSEKDNSDKVQRYDPSTDEWECMAPTPFSQRCISAIAHNDIIYVVGGLLDVIYSYNPSNDSWGKVANLPMKVESCGLTVCNEKLFIVGGRDECAAAVDGVWSFCPDSGLLSKELPMSRCVSYHGCVTITQHTPKKS